MGSYGDWLLKTREGMGWSRSTLAQKSGVSEVGIYNIEAGRTENPRQETKAKLQKALQKTPSEKLVKEIAEESQIAGIGQLEDFDPHIVGERPKVNGVYVFYDATKRPIYVGRSSRQTIAVRVSQHEEKFWFKRPLVESASFVKIDDESLCEQVEDVLIKFLKSNALLNKRGLAK